VPQERQEGLIASRVPNPYFSLSPASWSHDKLIGPKSPCDLRRIGRRRFLLFLYYLSEVCVMSFFVGLDVSKEKFDACCIGEKGEKVFTLTGSMDREGFEKLIVRLPQDKTLFLLGMESTASYHIPLFAYLAAEDYQVVVINPLLINGFSKRSLRKTKTDKKDAFTIAQFMLREGNTLSVKALDNLTAELRDLARRRANLPIT
jgi:hypothetical protein